MKELFSKYNITLTDQQLEKFNVYYEILVEYNKKFNLTTVTERKDAEVKHFLDSVLWINDLKGITLIDIGSGGGFPALPIKIMREEIELTMLEATGKKCEFLKIAAAEMKLKNVEVINGRAEDLAKMPKYREKYEICTARAVARLNTLCEYCMPFVKVGGIFTAYKGNADEELIEAKNAIHILGGECINVDKFLLEGAERQIIRIQKNKSTPEKYPRGNGKERKNPL